MLKRISTVFLCTATSLSGLLPATIQAGPSLPAACAQGTGFDMAGSPSESGEPFASADASSSPSAPTGFAAAPSDSAQPPPPDFFSSPAEPAAREPAASPTRAVVTEQPKGLAPDAHPEAASSGEQRSTAKRKQAGAAGLAPLSEAAREQGGAPSKSVASRQAPGKVERAREDRSSRQRLGLVSRVWNGVVSTPGAVYRESIEQWKSGVRDMTNNSSNPCAIFPAAFVSFPFCTAAGVVSGVGQSFRGEASEPTATASRPADSKSSSRKTAQAPARSQLEY